MDLTPEGLNRLFHELVPFLAKTGIRVEAVQRGYVKMSLPLQGNENHMGTMYAGALFTLGEIPGGGLFMATFDSGKYILLLTEMTIRFWKKADTDVFVEASLEESEIARMERELEQSGRADYSLENRIVDARGNVVAVCSGQYQLRKVADA